MLLKTIISVCTLTLKWLLFVSRPLYEGHSKSSKTNSKKKTLNMVTK